MPLVRFQVRNEYGLGQPQLYKEANREDPKAVLDGVAVAGLVGILRQLGDLAEYVFHSFASNFSYISCISYYPFEFSCIFCLLGFSAFTVHFTVNFCVFGTFVNFDSVVEVNTIFHFWSCTNGVWMDGRFCFILNCAVLSCRWVFLAFSLCFCF